MTDSYSILNTKINSIIDKYDKIKEYKLIPIDNIIEKDVEEEIEKLKNGRFIVSVCGQIKAGKSTLLNALIFEDDILPAADTPLTAKLTIIRFGEEPKFVVEFYNTKDWEDLKKQTYTKPDPEKEGEKIERSYFDDFLREYVNRSISEGIYEEEVIKEENLIKTETDFGKLKYYVGADGLYTPFVKQIDIYYPSDFLQKIDIVDTPGTNDPNKLRSKITLDWIKKSDAVVYVAYAGRAFDEMDIDFIDEYLIHIQPNVMIFAVNKKDTINSESELREWIEKGVRRNNRLKRRNIMKSDDSIVYVSALAGLLDKMDKNGKEIPKELGYYFDKFDENGYLDKHNIDELKGTIEKKIIENKEEELFKAAERKVEAIFDKNIIKLENEISYKKNELENLSLTEEEFEKKREKLEEEKVKLSSEIEKFKVEIEILKKNQELKIEEKIREGKGEVLKGILGEIKKSENTWHVIKNLSWFIKNTFWSYEEKIKNVAYDFVNNKFLEILENALKEKLIRINKNRSIHEISISAYEWIEKFEKELREIEERIAYKMNPDEVEKIIKENLGKSKWGELKKMLFSFVTNLSVPPKKVETYIKPILEGGLNLAFDDINSNIKRATEFIVDDGRKIFEKTIKEELKNIRESLEKTENNLKNKKENTERLKRATKELEAKKIEIEQLKKAIVK